MSDRNKVVRELEHMAGIINQYTDMLSVDCDSWVILDALELLKEQEPKLVKVDGDDVLCPLCGNKEFRGSKSMKKTNNECEETTPGKWIYVSHNPCYSPFDDSPPDFYRCSGCGYITGNRTKYCPECGQECN